MVASNRSVDWSVLRAQFPAAERFVYLDIARKAILPSWVDDAIGEWLADVHHHAGAAAFDMGSVEQTRIAVATLFGAPPHNVALIKNTSEGINVVAQGLPLAPGDNVVISEFEHENNTLPWRHLSARGIELRRAKCDAAGRITVDCYRALVDAHTRVLGAAWVAYGNGYRCDVPALAEFCRSRGIRLVIDAIQASGVLATPLSALGADVIAAGGHKAQFSLAGAGFLYATDEMIDTITPPYAAKFSFVSNDRANLRPELAHDAHRFEYGNPNFLGAWVQRRSAERLAAIGLANIEQRVRELTTGLIERAERNRLAIATPPAWNERAGIVSFIVRGDADRVVAELRNRRIVCSAKDGYLRCATHFYNNEDDLDLFVDALSTLEYGAQS